jgi:hypothetical protein
MINDSRAVITDALERLGFTDITIDIGARSSSTDGTADYTVRFIASRGHFQLGDSNDKLLWEPYRYSNPANAYKGPFTSVIPINITARRISRN